MQDKWEPEEYAVIEQPIAGTPVYRVQPVNGGNIRTLHRNLLLPLGVNLEPDYKSDDSILDEDSDDDSVELTVSKTQLHGKRKSKEDSSKGKSQFEIVEENLNLRRRNMLNLNLNQIFSQAYVLSLIQLLHLVQSWKNQK